MFSTEEQKLGSTYLAWNSKSSESIVKAINVYVLTGPSKRPKYLKINIFEEKEFLKSNLQLKKIKIKFYYFVRPSL